MRARLVILCLCVELENGEPEDYCCKDGILEANKSVVLEILAKYIAKQFGYPSGFGGAIVHFIMNKQNAQQYEAVLENIHIQPTEIVLDIGFGNGYLIKMLLKHNPHRVYGVEVSPDMLNRVGSKLKHFISKGKLILCLANVNRLPYNDTFFDKISTVNTLYFWDDAEVCFAEIRRTLKPCGIFINVFYTKELLDKIHHTQYMYSKYSVSQVIEMTIKSGLKIKQIIELQKNISYCIIAEK